MARLRGDGSDEAMRRLHRVNPSALSGGVFPPAARRPRRRLTMTKVVSKIAAGETKIIGDQTFSFKGNITGDVGCCVLFQLAF